MMSQAVVDAVRILQDRTRKARDNYELERIDRALDEILRNPMNITPAKAQVKSAWGHAYTVLEKRKALTRPQPIEEMFAHPQVEEFGYAQTEMICWISSELGFKDAERSLLIDLALGHDCEILAQRDGLPVQRVREHISRSRKRARGLKANLFLTA
ncbi:hypothetical protein [Streptomyces griseus]|uniref:hypothetical protein n=1 Tax=Streptomyces griseus TaxID=1911 RepID=UPI0036812D33